MDCLGAAHGWGWSTNAPPAPPKMCHTYRAMMKLDSYTLPKEDPKKYIIHVTQPRVLLKSAFFHRKSAAFVTSRNPDIDCILMHNF